MVAVVNEEIGLELSSAAGSKVDAAAAAAEETSTTDPPSDSQKSERDHTEDIAIGDAQEITVPAQEGEHTEADVVVDEMEVTEEPRKPKSAYFCYLETVRASITEELGTGKSSAVVKLAAERWSKLAADEKAPFESKAAELKSKYGKAFKAFMARGGVRRMKKKVHAIPKKLKKVARDPRQPLKPKSAFFIFLDSERTSLAEAVGSKKGSLVVKRGAEKWKGMPGEAKAQYEVQAAELKATYGDQMKTFKAEGGVSVKKRRYEDVSPPALARRSGRPVGQEMTPPKRTAPPRVKLNVGARITAIAQNGGSLAEGEKLSIKRDLRKGTSPNAIAVYDGSLGSHVGYLDEVIAARLTPFLEKNPACRLSGRVQLAEGTASGSNRVTEGSKSSGMHDIVAEVCLSVPADMAPLLETFEASLHLPLGAELVVAEFCDAIDGDADSPMPTVALLDSPSSHDVDPDSQLSATVDMA